MKRWHLPSLTGSSDKRTEREPGADAPRVASVGRQKPRVLFSSPECRIVVIDLLAGDELGDHRVRERAVVQVVSGRIVIEADGETAECQTGALVTFDPGERHTLRGLDDARLLLVLAPWPATVPDTPAETPDEQHLPLNATAEPIASSATPPTDNIEADGVTGGDADILTAISDALVDFPADEIIIAAHADRDSHRREQNLADKIRDCHPQPVTELLVEADDLAVTKA